MTEQTIQIPDLTVEEAQQTVYNLDEVLKSLDHAIFNGVDEGFDPILIAECVPVANLVRSSRNKIQRALIGVGATVQPQPMHH